MPAAAISIQPATGLADGQFVKINFQNLTPGEYLFFRQCVATPKSTTFRDMYSGRPADCTPRNTRLFGIADGTGGGSTYFPVQANDSDGLATDDQLPRPKKGPRPPIKKIQCDSQHDCSLVAVTSERRTFTARISFAPSPAECPPPGATTPLGSGSAAATRAMYRWSALSCVPPQSLSVGYATHNEHKAYEDFSKGLTDFGITGPGPAQQPVSGSSPSSSPGTAAPTYKLAPTSVSAAVLAYRAYDKNGTQITNLTLTPDLIAKAFMGERIPNFSTVPAIRDLNPGIAFPPRSRVVARADFNSETYMFTSWLAAMAPDVWKPPASPSPDIFPATGADLQFGEAAAAREIIAPNGTFDPDVVVMGLIDSSTAVFYGLPTVKIKMPDGSVLAPTTDSILEAVADAQAAPDGTLMPRWNSPEHPRAYPLPMVTYMIVPTNTIDPAKGEILAKFLRYAVKDGRALIGDLDGYAPLPANLVEASLAAADLIPVPSAAGPRPAPSPQPSPIPTPHATPAPTPTATPIEPAAGSTIPLVPALPPLPDLPPLPGLLPGSAAGSFGSGSVGPRMPPASGARLAVPSPCPSGSGTACHAGASPTPPSVVATLTYSQGMQLVADAHSEPGVPERLVLPGVVGLALLFLGGGAGLQLWAHSLARRRR